MIKVLKLGFGLSTYLAFIAPSMAQEYPLPIKALEEKGVQVMSSFEAPSGLKGYAAQYQGRAMALYLTGDGEHVLIGSLLDSQAQDLTSDVLDELVNQPMGELMWQRLQDSHWIADGADSAPRVVYMFNDPNCPYCNMFWQQARPWVDAGLVQLRHVMVGMLRPDSAAKAASLISAADPQKKLHIHESAGKSSKLSAMKNIPVEVEAKLAQNLQLMMDLGAQATPSLVYLDEQGLIQQHQGVPQGAELGLVLGRRQIPASGK